LQLTGKISLVFDFSSFRWRGKAKPVCRGR